MYSQCLVAAILVALASGKPLPAGTISSAIAQGMGGPPSPPAPPATDTPITSTTLSKRNSTCEPQPLGSGPQITPDDVPTFVKDPFFASTALAAPTPSGYTSVFTNLNASSQSHQYLGYHLLPTYSTAQCADHCTSTANCTSFNIYFERDPTLDPHPVSCPNPPSTTNIKCALWTVPVTTPSAWNDGQYRADFQVAVAGSNGYVLDRLAAPPGYAAPTYLGDVAIDALTDCEGEYTYLDLRIWADRDFELGRCAEACDDYHLAGEAAAAAGRTCRFVNTYQLTRDGDEVGQYCAMYGAVWDRATATNNGSVVEGVEYAVRNSYGLGVVVVA